MLPAVLALAAQVSANVLVPTHSRSLAMGGAGLASYGGPLALRLDPASLASITSQRLSYGHLSWLDGMAQDQLAYAQRPQVGTVLALGLGYLGVPDFDSTGGLEPSFSAGVAQVDMGFAQQLQGPAASLSLGGALTYVDQKLGSLALRDLAATAGMQWQSPWAPLALGAVVSQVSLYSSYGSPPPLEAAVGVALEGPAFTLAIDSSVLATGLAGLRCGAEWRPLNPLALRVGASNDTAPGSPLAFSTGLGLRWDGWAAGLAWQDRGSLGSAMLVSLDLRFGEPTPVSVDYPGEDVGMPPGPAVGPPAIKVAAKPMGREPAKAADWAAGDFDLAAEVHGQGVRLSWADQSPGQSDVAGYEMLMGMVPEAPLLRTGAGTFKEVSWRDEMAVRGMTYYFRVRLLDQAGKVLRSSRVKAVQMP